MHTVKCTCPERESVLRYWCYRATKISCRFRRSHTLRSADGAVFGGGNVECKHEKWNDVSIKFR